MHRVRASLPLALGLALAFPFAACSDDVGDNTQTGVTYGAHDHVSGAAYSALAVEVDYVTGHAPDADVLAEVQEALDRMIAAGQLGKPDGVSFVLDEELSPGGADKTWTLAELQQLARDHRDLAVADDSASIHMLYVDGHYEGDGDGGTVLGFAYGGSWMVMLADNIEGACDGSTSLGGPLLAGLRERVCAHAEASVLLHELGHLFGLVNNGTAMVDDHEDPDHRAHDADPDCLMYWAIERSSAVDLIAERFTGGGEPTLGFCDASLADLAAVAGADQ